MQKLCINIYRARYDKEPAYDDLKEIAEIIAWNIFQMDGLKYVIPDSCDRMGKQEPVESLFYVPEEDDENIETEPDECIGCVKNDPLRHRGIYAMTMDWDSGKAVRFVDLLYRD